MAAKTHNELISEINGLTYNYVGGLIANQNTGLLTDIIDSMEISGSTQFMGLVSYQNTVMLAPVMAYVWTDTNNNIVRVYEPLRNNDVSWQNNVKNVSMSEYFTDRFPFDNVTCINNKLNNCLFDKLTLTNAQSLVFISNNISNIGIDFASLYSIQITNCNIIGDIFLGNPEYIANYITLAGNSILFSHCNINFGTDSSSSYINDIGANSQFTELILISPNIDCYGNQVHISETIFYQNAGAEFYVNGAAINNCILESKSYVDVVNGVNNSTFKTNSYLGIGYGDTFSSQTVTDNGDGSTTFTFSGDMTSNFNAGGNLVDYNYTFVGNKVASATYDSVNDTFTLILYVDSTKYVGFTCDFSFYYRMDCSYCNIGTTVENIGDKQNLSVDNSTLFSSRRFDLTQSYSFLNVFNYSAINAITEFLPGDDYSLLKDPNDSTFNIWVNDGGTIKGIIPAQPDWNAVSGTSEILNKPVIPAAQVNSDWNSNSGVSQILNKPTIPAQFSPIAGSNISLTGTYPDITINGTSTPMISLTKTQADAAISGNTLVPGQFYEISGIATSLYNDGTNSGSTIILQASTTNKFNSEGDGIFYNPKYNSSLSENGIWNKYLIPLQNMRDNSTGTFIRNETVTSNDGSTGKFIAQDLIEWVSGTWTSSTSVTGATSGAVQSFASNLYTPFVHPSINDRMIWGGYSWKNLTGNIGNSTDIHTLDSTNWVKDGYNNINYNIVINKISYDYINDIIKSRYEVNGNNYIEQNDISNFQFGNPSFTYNNKVEKGGVMECLNQSGTFYNNSASFGGNISSNIITHGASFYANEVVQFGHISGNIIPGYGGSILHENYLEDSSINSNSINYGGEIGFNKLSVSSGINSNFINSQWIIFCMLVYGEISGVTLKNSHNFYNITINHGTITNTVPTTHVSYCNIEPNATLTGTVTTATLAGNYSKTIYCRPDGVSKIRYYNNSDVMAIEDIT